MHQEAKRKNNVKDKLHAVLVVIAVVVAMLSCKITHEIVVSRGMLQYYEAP